jgi:uncharacterized protein (DUF488 family)
MDEFIQLLIKHSITVICDVRSTPYSKYTSQFNYEFIKHDLKKAGIQYVYLGKELGPRSDESSCYINGKVQYDLLAKTNMFKEGIARIKKGVEMYSVALMCAEKDPAICHRTILVCRHLRKEDFQISHILEDGSLEDNSDTERRLMKMLKIPEQTLFDRPEDLVERAYDLQGERIAYNIKTENQDEIGSEQL